jgi:hypothetical protein
MTAHHALVPVSDHSFGVFDDYEIPIDTADWSTGLIVTMDTGATIYTGVDRGIVRVSVELRGTAPADIDTEAWDDIVEASINAPHGRLRVHLLEYGPDRTAPDLPLLSTTGPGTYRMRAHARGRDDHFDAVWMQPSEDYLLTLWPAPPQPSLIIRATDRCGYGLRLASLSTPAKDPARQPPGHQELQARNAELRATLLQSSPEQPPAS